MNVSSRMREHIRQNVWGIVAVFIAITGTAVALPGKNTVNSGDIKNANVKLADLASGAVDSTKVVDDSLTGADIRESTLEGVQGVQGAQGPAGPAGATGPSGAQGVPGTNASVNGVVAGGDLSGTYPAPQVLESGLTAGGDLSGALDAATIDNDAVDSAAVAPDSIQSSDIADSITAEVVTATEIADPVFVKSGETAPTRTLVGGVMPALSFSPTTRNSVLILIRVPRGGVSNTTMTAAISWSPSTGSPSGDQVVWGADVYTINQLDDATPAAPDGTVTSTPSNGTATDQMRLSVLQFTGVGVTTGTPILINFFRDTANPSDDHPFAADLHAIGFEFETPR